jgi:hypothetical protein
VTEELDRHFRIVVPQIRDGKVVPFLGAGANLTSRPSEATWNPIERLYLPSGVELASYLADRHEYQFPDRDNLVRVAEYIALTVGDGPLYDSLRELFDADYPITPLHRLMARLPRILRERGIPPVQLIVTTNYDDLLERAFREEDEPFDVVAFMAVGDEAGKFLHLSPDGEPRLIEEGEANEYRHLPLNEEGRLVRPVILKLHGAIDRQHSDRDSFVITEDDYIEYLGLGDISGLIPVTLRVTLKRSNFLFLGYSLRDWNLRAILYRIWSAQRTGYKSWAIQYRPDELDKQAWDQRGVQILDIPLDEYVAELQERLEHLPASGAMANA